MKKVWFLLGTAVFALSACTSTSSKTSTSEVVQTSGGITLSDDQEITLSTNNELATADSTLMQDIQTTTAGNQYFEGLFRLDENNIAQPAGASNYQVSDDGLTYTFNLREDAIWSNGDPVTANDYVYAWQKMVDPASAAPYAYMFSSIVNAEEIINRNLEVEELGIEAVSDTQFTVSLTVPISYFPEMLTNPYFFPQNQSFVEEQGDAYGTTSENTVYNGPFELANWQGGNQEWDYIPNDDYWDAENVYLDKIHMQVVKETATAVNLFESGQLDNALLTGEYAKQFQTDERYVIEDVANTTSLEFNFDNEFLANKNIRTAISAVIDRDVVTENLLGNGSRSATGFVPDNFVKDPTTEKDYTEDQPDYQVYDLELAQSSLATAKEELNMDSFDFTILVDDTETNRQIAEYVQGAIMENLDGVNIEIQAVPKNNRIAQAKEGDFDIMLSGWNAIIPDPVNMLDKGDSTTTFNYGNYANEDFDNLLALAEGENANNLEERFTNLHDAETIFMEEVGVAPIFHSSEAFLWNPQLEGIVRNSVGSRYSFKNAYVAAE
ncbi:peptide ABC transporter substrate-binding protein [Aerococcus sp. 1KP-2016]|uniref:peptide ABC transporter substrate-binding protein n=1 Tax=Aerococcus sp. 1KP-2016 TaxID=1981982 RepID=UPI000B9871D4|nr:peptide ABC transporter substrate-binding protein [Aerococcus sp. 1KP-2016]OYQ66507.1 peptide ABC transporter substrate-binding protein [Aerococcus sp. 1KP-2016]